MDRPPRPLIPRAATRRPTPQPARPLGAGIGFLAAGIWALFFAFWMPLPGWTPILPMLLGFLAIFVAVVLIGVSVGSWLSGRRG